MIHFKFTKSLWRELNSWPLPYQGSALPLSYKGWRAEDGSRTRYLQLGRLSLYQMSYFREEGVSLGVHVKCGCGISIFNIHTSPAHSHWHSHALRGERRIRTSEGCANRFTVCPIWPLWNLPAICSDLIYGADGRIRTADRLITNQLLWPAELHRQHAKNIKKADLFEKGLQKYILLFNYQKLFQITYQNC